MTAATGPAAGSLAITTSGKALELALESIGWQLLSVEIDVAAQTARIELVQGDLRVTFDARNGRTSIARELMERTRRRVGRKGDFIVAEEIETRFSGRQSCGGFRSGLRTLAHYVADNSPRALTHSEARDIFRPLLASPTGATP